MPVDWDGSGDLPGGLGGVVKPFWRAGSGWEALQ